jgi:hypothetical protein
MRRTHVLISEEQSTFTVLEDSGVFIDRYNVNRVTVMPENKMDSYV